MGFSKRLLVLTAVAARVNDVGDAVVVEGLSLSCIIEVYVERVEHALCAC